MNKALKILTNKKLGVLIVRDESKRTCGIITDGQIRRFSQKNSKFYLLPVKQIMTKKPINIDKNELAAKALSLMNKKNYLLIVINKKFKQNNWSNTHSYNLAIKHILNDKKNCCFSNYFNYIFRTLF